MNISIVIPTLKSKSSIDILNFLRRNEIIIVRELGRAKSRNIGASKASNQFILFIDDDISFSEATYKNYVLNTLQNHPKTIVCKEHPVLGTRVMGISKQLFWKLGGFDETFETGEDADFGFKAMQQNIKIRYIPHNLIHHKNHPRPPIRKEQLNHTKNTIRYLLRYHKCWLGGKRQGIHPVNIRNCFWLFIQAPKKGFWTIIHVVQATASFFCYLFRDKKLAIDLK